jgi:hypothetical protein
MLRVVKPVVPVGPEGLIPSQGDIVPSFGMLFLGAFSMLRKTTAILFCLSIHKDQFGFGWTDLVEIMYLSSTLKSVMKFKFG